MTTFTVRKPSGTANNQRGIIHSRHRSAAALRPFCGLAFDLVGAICSCVSFFASRKRNADVTCPAVSFAVATAVSKNTSGIAASF